MPGVAAGHILDGFDLSKDVFCGMNGKNGNSVLEKESFSWKKMRFSGFRGRCLEYFYIFAMITTPKQLNFKTMKELVEKINAEFEVFAANAAAQVEKNNKAAGTRARKSALELSKLMKEFRKVSVEASK